MYLNVERKQIYATTAGKPFDLSQPSVVFVHGAGMDQSVWALQSRYLAYHGHNIFALNLPGHGRYAEHKTKESSGTGFKVAPKHLDKHWISAKLSLSAKPAYSEGAPRASITEIADWLPKYFDAAGLKKPLLVGHSMGALAAMECAARHPERVSRLALLGAAPHMSVHPALLEAAKNDDNLAYELVTAWGHGPTGHFGGNRAPGLWMMGNAIQIMARSATKVLYVDLLACDIYAAGLEAAANVSCPTLVIAGRADRMSPAKAAAQLAAAMPDATLVTLPDCGHMMMVEKPDATLDALINFFN